MGKCKDCKSLNFDRFPYEGFCTLHQASRMRPFEQECYAFTLKVET